MKLKVLMVVDYAPDYREAFFQQLGQKCELTVVAQNLSSNNLKAPLERKNYNYIELPSKKCFGFIWQPGLSYIFKKKDWDIFCIGSSMRHLDRILIFLKNKKYRSKWVWRGQMFGKLSSRKFMFYPRKFLLENSLISLTYNLEERDKLRSFVRSKVDSFNNSEVCIKEFREPSFNNDDTLNLLFVGRNQPRKKLERLIRLAQVNKDINIRLIGPNMEQLIISNDLIQARRVAIYPAMRGEELNEHFDWAHLVVNPGHLGLLVLNASRHAKPIVVDSSSTHAPEVEVAKRSNQFFIDFSNENVVNSFFSQLVGDRRDLKNRGEALQKLAKSEYTIEYMVDTHINAFRYVSDTNC